MNATVRIAMWSGPRNLSTAMMRSFGSRADTICIDEPFYAAFLAETGVRHPMREDVLAAHPTDPHAVALDLAERNPRKPVFYQKHMTHHMVAAIPRDWMARVRNVFLIRHPARVLASYARKVEDVSLEAIGFSQQVELFDHTVNTLGQLPIVIDSDDVLRNPEAVLTRLCDALSISFDAAMLSWTPGPKPEDGAWAPHWYDAVWRSSGFAEPAGALPDAPSELRPILDQALPIYERLARFKTS